MLAVVVAQICYNTMGALQALCYSDSAPLVLALLVCCLQVILSEASPAAVCPPFTAWVKQIQGVPFMTFMRCK